MDKIAGLAAEKLKFLGREDLSRLLLESRIQIARAVEGGCFAVLEEEEYEVCSPKSDFLVLKSLSAQDKKVIQGVLNDIFPEKKDQISELNFYSFQGES